MIVETNREELQQPVFTAIDALEYPELHDESIPFMAFLKQLTKLMSAAGVRDFTMQARTQTRSPAPYPHLCAACCLFQWGQCSQLRQQLPAQLEVPW